MELHWRTNSDGRESPSERSLAGLIARSSDTGITYTMIPTPLNSTAWELTITDPASSLTRPVAYHHNDAHTLYKIAQATEDEAWQERYQ